MSIEDLPKTFRDAIAVTQILKIRYIWIDSLCIIQDDAQDWQREAAKMSYIYQEGFLNIAAASASSCHDGCFLRRDHAGVRVWHPQGFSKDIIVRFHDGSEDFRELWHGPLSDRGWVLQELAHSPRTLHLTKNFMVWECRSRFTTEDGSTDGLASDYSSLKPNSVDCNVAGRIRFW